MRPGRPAGLSFYQFERVATFTAASMGDGCDPHWYVSVNGPMPRDADSWRDVTEELGKLLATHARGTDLFECDFSTSTEVDQIASRVIMMDAYSPYFSYWIVAVCGIPEIMLTGTAGDWQKIRARVDRLADLGLQTWCRSLIPIADHFVRAAAGDVDVAFWKRIYNPQDTYGGKVITGWASRFYPYLEDDGSQEWPNPMLDLPIDEPRDLTLPDPAHRWGYSGPGIRSSAVPATLSKAIIKVNGRADGANETVALHAGLIGIAQDDDGALRPISGWHLVSAQPHIDDAIDRIIRDHSTTAPGSRRRAQGTPELMALYARIGSASLFDCAWRLLPADEHRTVYRGMNLLSMTPIIELADGRMIAEASNRRGAEIYWVVGRFAPEVHEGPIQLMNADLLDVRQTCPSTARRWRCCWRSRWRRVVTSPAWRPADCPKWKVVLRDDGSGVAWLDQLPMA